jgi:lipoprotein-anchoring transpeptidase ErfK/SrfK
VVVRSTGWRLPAFAEPSEAAVRTHRLWANNPWGQRIAYEVLEILRDDEGQGWYRIRIPFRPNGSTGWVRANDVGVDRVQGRIVVDLSSHVLRHYRRGDLVSRLDVATGAPATPTPPGRYFVWARVSYDSPGGPYGAYALGLSGFSKVLTDWPGGGRLAIHGTADPTDIGRAVSHGCVRVYNADLLRALREVPIGTPVRFRP